ncbi:hypothetical protein BC826DRAFT_442465 [Russula brevipes]|nr:hypothetical protein BC826DRAFT_442465 [Russula brevipes]
MSKFIFALFSAIALLGLIVPSFAHKPALLPTAVSSPKIGSRSGVPPSSIGSLYGNIEVHNKAGRIGFVEFSEYGIVSLSSVPSPCVFDPSQNTLAFAGNSKTKPMPIGVDAHFDQLGPNSEAVSGFMAPSPYPDNIWKVYSDRRLGFTSKNTVYIAQDTSTGIGDFILTGNPANLHDEEVEFYLV